MTPHDLWLLQPERDLLVGLLTLNPRPREVAFLLAAGYSRRQIAERLYIEMETVRCHQQTIWRTCGLPVRTRRPEFIWRMRRLQRALAEWEMDMAEYGELEAA